MASTDVTSSTRRAAPGPAGSTGPAPKPLRRRKGLPSGRAVVGGFLIALAATGVFVAYTSATAAPTTSYVVVTRDLPFGHQLQPGDLALVPLDLPETVAARAFNDVDVLVGASLVSPLGNGEMLQQSSVTAAAGAGLVEVSFPIESDRALLGALKANERVDVLATFGSGQDAYTLTLVRGAILLGHDTESGGGLQGGSGSGRVLRLGLASTEQAVAVTHAVNAGIVSVVRTTALDPDAPPAPRVYAPDPGDDSVPERVEVDDLGRLFVPDVPAPDSGDASDQTDADTQDRAEEAAERETEH